MPTTPAQKKANIIRWLGYQSDTEDIALVTNKITAAIADTDIALIIDQSCDRLLAMETRIYDQALRVPHGNLYLINYVEMSLEIRRLMNILGLPYKANAEQVWQSSGAFQTFISASLTWVEPVSGADDCGNLPSSCP
ncbi:MAG: hypothetical protein ACK5X3_12620 [Pseudomonadota bacterium]|jgi:hypothetical protein